MIGVLGPILSALAPVIAGVVTDITGRPTSAEEALASLRKLAASPPRAVDLDRGALRDIAARAGAEPAPADDIGEVP